MSTTTPERSALTADPIGLAKLWAMRLRLRLTELAMVEDHAGAAETADDLADLLRALAEDSPSDCRSAVSRVECGETIYQVSHRLLEEAAAKAIAAREAVIQ